MYVLVCNKKNYIVVNKYKKKKIELYTKYVQKIVIKKI